MPATKQTKSEKKVAEAFHEVHASPPRTLGKTQTKAERQSQLTAIALSKAKAAGADIPKPKGKKASKASS
jgi:hypothetical protein